MEICQLFECQPCMRQNVAPHQSNLICNFWLRIINLLQFEFVFEFMFVQNFALWYKWNYYFSGPFLNFDSLLGGIIILWSHCILYYAHFYYYKSLYVFVKIGIHRMPLDTILFTLFHIFLVKIQH